MPSRRILFVPILRACLLLTCVLAAARARASPDLTLDPATVTRDVPARTGNPSASIDVDDCEKDVRFSFPLSLTGLPASSTPLQAWAGAGTTDCSVAAARTGSAPTCWPLLSGDIDTSTSTPVVHVSTRQIVAQLGIAAKTAFKDVANVDTMCHDTSLPAGPSDVTVWLLFTDASGVLVGTPAKYALKIDVRAPAPPTAVKASVADGALIVDFTASKDTDTASYTIYCEPVGAITSVDAGDAATGDASSGSDAGAGACPQGAFASGDASDAAPYVCGHVDGTGTSGIADRLSNGVRYTVAVAATDHYGNVGAPSAPSCASPQETTDFWRTYRDGGGLAGGGFCAVRAIGASPDTAPFAVALVALAVGIVRRRFHVRGAGVSRT